MVLPVLLAVGAVAAGLAAEPWFTLMGIGCLYLGSIPLAWHMTAPARHAPPADAPVDVKSAEPPGPLVSIPGGRAEPRA
ncbi:MAG: hypothetical protein WDO24_02315 [Pseudomonadota bacterium]